MDRCTRNTLFLYKSVILGLVFVLLVAVLSCGYFPIVGHLANITKAGCDKIIFLVNSSSRDNISFALLLFSFIAFVILLRKSIINQRYLNVSLRPSLIFLKVAKFIFKLYNPILQALRRGILHSQVYNFAIITD